MEYLGFFCAGCIMTFLGLRYTFKIYMISANERMKGLEMKLEKRKEGLITQQKELTEQKEAIQKLMYQMHHSGVRPSCVSILGLCQLYWMEVESGNYNNSNMNKYIQMIEKTTENLLEQNRRATKESEHLQ
jgi:hypothetical protein